MVTEKAVLRRKAAAELRATLKKSKIALEESRREHERAELVAAQLEEDTAAEHRLTEEAESRGYLPGVSDPEDTLLATPPKKSFWQRVGDWFTS
jgi:hypothetical protein